MVVSLLFSYLIVQLAPGDTTLPGAYVDSFRSTLLDPDPCETNYPEALDYNGITIVPMSCTYHDNFYTANPTDKPAYDTRYSATAPLMVRNESTPIITLQD